MRLYSGMSRDFIEDAVQNRIAEKLKDAFLRHYRYNVPNSEVNSWRNSLRAVSQVFQRANLTDQGVILEYQLPLTSKRLDCLICGKRSSSEDGAVIIELKQWDRCSEAGADNLVTTFIGGNERDTLHPSVQVRQYQHYLQDTHTAFYEEPSPVHLSSCAYLHNYFPCEGDHLFADCFKPVLKEHPAFTGDDVDPLAEFVTECVKGGDGYTILQKIERSRYRPSKKLMEHVGNVIKGKPEYVLLDEQLVVYESVLATARKGFHDRRKAVIIVTGGPGTGKSVIALNLMSDLLLESYNAHYATGSKAFTETLREIVGTRGEVQFKYFNSYMNAGPNEIDVLICDESHRIRRTSNNRFTPKTKQSNRSQLQEIIDVAKVSVFFIDDRQVVRPDEIGSSTLIREKAVENKCDIKEYQLEAQFRCAGSDAFVNWISNTLGIERTANILWESKDAFDFQIKETPEQLDHAIRQKVNEGHTGRLTAGFCWPWSDPNQDGTLIEDVEIESFRRPWNAKPGARLAKGIPKASVWAYIPGGIDQVGCIYTAQGFEFDYVGVIFGPDLTYNLDKQEWEGNWDESYDTVVKRDKTNFCNLVKNTYRVLLSRGLKGCYVHFMDRATEQFFKSRIDLTQST
jgi:uncharacterized protein